MEQCTIRKAYTTVIGTRTQSIKIKGSLNENEYTLIEEKVERRCGESRRKEEEQKKLKIKMRNFFIR